MDGNWMTPHISGTDFTEPCPRKKKIKLVFEDAGYRYSEVPKQWVHPGFLEVMDAKRIRSIEGEHVGSGNSLEV